MSECKHVWEEGVCIRVGCKADFKYATLEAENERLKKELVELEAKIPKPKVWCCEFAKSSNGWNHNEKCPNWVLKF